MKCTNCDCLNEWSKALLYTTASDTKFSILLLLRTLETLIVVDMSLKWKPTPLSTILVLLILFILVTSTFLASGGFRALAPPNFCWNFENSSTVYKIQNVTY
ncbi:hypothetical protein Droror1_Dr00000391 [Drosera rotundifolia]